MTSSDHSETQQGAAAPLRERAVLLGHDIRNAVTDILGGLALADLEPLDPASRQQLVRVRSASEQLARLTDEVLALVNGDPEAVEPAGADKTALRLKPFLADIEARWSAHAQEKGLRFTLELAPDLPREIGTNQGALERILANLIGNAIKHSARGDVALAVSMRAHETLCLAVRDSGRGFSDTALEHLFEAGARPQDSETPGSGLGLHIVRELADQIRARMEVGNRSLGGAEVSILLPRAAWAPGISAPAISADLPDLAGQCVLVAEDNETNQLVIRQMLETLGADYILASDGREALEHLSQHRFDLALIDIEMPRLSGLDLIRTLREREADKKNLPVLAITAYVLSANREEIYDAGADGILAKPIMSIESFGEAIAAVLRKVRNAPVLADPAATDTRPFSTVSLDRLLALAGPDGAHELLERLRQDFQSVLTGIQDGLQASDFALLRSRTHVLISLAGAIGAEHLQSLAERLNAAAIAKTEDEVLSCGPNVVQRVNAVMARLDAEYTKRFAEGAA